MSRRASIPRLHAALVRLALFLPFLLPLMFGPTAPIAIRLLGGEPAHTCACGMRAGECGCPECARIEKQKVADAKRPMFRTSCEDEEPVYATPPPRVLGAADFVVAEAPFEVARRASSRSLIRSQTHPRPPVPPPRA